jgi:hypothetical protein
MRRILISIAALALLFTGAAAAAEPPLQQFVSQAGRFSVLMPGTPQLTTQTVALKGGEKVTLYVFAVSLDNDNIAYEVMYNDFPSNYANGPAETQLKASRDVAVASAGAGAKLLSDSAISLNGVPGRAFMVQNNDGYNIAAHFYLVNHRMYQVLTVASKGHSAVNRDAFMNSFKIR